MAIARLTDLNPAERRIAELYARLSMSGRTRPRVMNEILLACEAAGITCTPTDYYALLKTTKFKTYVKALRLGTRDSALARLEAQMHSRLDDYEWGLKRAREVDDYKEARVGNAEYLDRMNVTLKKDAAPLQAVQIVLTTTNFSRANPLDVEPIPLMVTKGSAE